MRLHLFRSAVRIAVLMAGDAAVLFLLQVLIRGVRDQLWLGAAASSLMSRLLPVGGVTLVELLPAVWLGLIVLGTYSASDRRRDAGRLLAGATLGLGLAFGGYLWNQFSPLGGFGFILLAILTGGLLIVGRHIIDQVVRMLWPIGTGAARALLIGRPDEARRALEHPALANPRQFTIGAILHPDELELKAKRGGFLRLCQTINRYRADTLVLSGRLDDEALALIIEASGAAGCQLYALPRPFAPHAVEFQTLWRRGAPLVALNRAALRGRQFLVKRVLDVVGSLISLLLLSPLMAAIALAIRLDTRGPVVFSQVRVGRDGRLFRCYKFRSMKAGAEEFLRADEMLYNEYRRNHFKLPLEQDPRLTRVGRILRKTSLDELPQFWNVLMGEMSLVGPRPVVPDELNHYGDGAFLFLSIRPGMTGAWAVEGRSQVGYPDRAHIELSYVREWNLWKDLGLLLKTIPAVLYMRGAN
jgi:exopolysaccharide biosynthesis polyprenyl glycosylphosphotransferase